MARTKDAAKRKSGDAEPMSPEQVIVKRPRRFLVYNEDEPAPAPAPVPAPAPAPAPRRTTRQSSKINVVQSTVNKNDKKNANRKDKVVEERIEEAVENSQERVESDDEEVTNTGDERENSEKVGEDAAEKEGGVDDDNEDADDNEEEISADMMPNTAEETGEVGKERLEEEQDGSKNGEDGFEDAEQEAENAVGEEEGNVSGEKEDAGQVELSAEIEALFGSEGDQIDTEEQADGEVQQPRRHGKEVAEEEDPDRLSVPICYKTIDISKYGLKTFLDDNFPFPAKITIRASMNNFRRFRNQLVECKIIHLFRRTCFGHFLKLPDQWKTFNGQLVHSLLMRRIICRKECEIWFLVEGNPLCFGLKEFATITGLYCGDVQEEVKETVADGQDFYEKLVKVAGGGLNGERLLNLMRSKRLGDRERLKVSLIWFVHSFLIARDESANVDKDWVKLATNIDVFQRYPWGRECFEWTLSSLTKPLVPPGVKKANMRLKNLIVSTETKPAAYALMGFPWALMAWAYEAIPSIGRLATKSKEMPSPLPRMLRWFNFRASAADPFDQKATRVEVVHPFLYPTMRELETPYIRSMVPLSDVSDSAIDNLKAELELVTHLSSTTDVPMTCSGSSIGRKGKKVGVDDDVQCEEGLGRAAGKEGAAGQEEASVQGCRHCAEIKDQLAVMTVKIDEIQQHLKKPVSVKVVTSPYAILNKLRKRRAAHEAWKEKMLEKKPVDVFKKVKKSHKKEFYEWLNDQSVEKRQGLTCVQDKNWFNELRRMGPWCDDEHIVEIMALMRKRHTEYPRHYDQCDLIVDTWFCESLTSIWREKEFEVEKSKIADKRKKKKKFDELVDATVFDDDLLLYVRGGRPVPNGRTWIGANKLYCIWNQENKHFVLVVFDLEEAKILIYDCNHLVYTDPQFKEAVQPLSRFMPMFLKQSGKFDHLGDKLTTSWPWERVMELPHNYQSESCGAYALKFIDFLITKTPMDNLHDNTMEEFREKFAVEVFKGRMAP